MRRSLLWKMFFRFASHSDLWFWFRYDQLKNICTAIERPQIISAAPWLTFKKRFEFRKSSTVRSHISWDGYLRDGVFLFWDLVLDFAFHASLLFCFFMLFCFFAFLRFCLSAFLLIRFSASPLSALLFCFSAFLLFCFSAFLFLCFSASLLSASLLMLLLFCFSTSLLSADLLLLLCSFACVSVWQFFCSFASS